MKSILKKRKLFPLFAISMIILFNGLYLTSGIAYHMEGEGATFFLEKDDPLEYGVILPEPNMYATLSITGSNQGEFALLWSEGTEITRQIVDYPGEDISVVYPWYIPGYIDSTTNNDFFNPWATLWLNVSAYNAESETLSPYTINTAFNYYIMPETGKLQVPINHSIPMQIDILINNPGPKILKYDWLTDDPSNIGQSIDLISPSGKGVDFYKETATTHAVSPPADIFDYLTFVAHEEGTYRLLIYAWHISDKPAYLSLEFLGSSISSFSLETLIFEGNGDEVLTIDETEHSSWRANWISIIGEKGDIFRFELNKDYTTGEEPIIRIWSPCDNGYIRFPPIAEGIHEIYFPTSGKAYISFIDADYGDWYRYALYLSKYEDINYNIGGNLTTIRISRDQSKVIEFSLEEDAFVRFNYTSTPPGNPYLDALGILNAFIFLDSKDFDCHEILSPIETKMVDNEWFYYYYMPNGTYKAVIKNTDEANDGVFVISSKIVEFSNNYIPINYLNYPDTNPSQTLTLEFEQDEFYNELYEAKYVYLDITEPGQYILNTTINATNYITVIPPVNQFAVVVYNSSAGTYHNWTEEALNPSKSFPAFSDDGGNERDDILYIGCLQKNEIISFSFSIPGTGGSDLDGYTWDGDSWIFDFLLGEGTSHFTSDGAIVLNSESAFFQDWTPGADFDIPGINESLFYWIGIENDGGNYGQLPYIQSLTFSNITSLVPNLNINLALVGESKYDNSDFWEPTITPEPEFLFENENYYVSEDTYLLETTNPYTIGFEEGLYKLLIIPEGGLNYTGPITINFAIENYWSYRHQDSYNITALSPEPNLHMWQINNYTAMGYAYGNGTIYNYELITTYNDTESELFHWGSNSYFVIECFGEAYQWTQLVVSCNNVSAYELYLMQDLPWIDNTGPNGEVMNIPFTAVNSTYEFGVLADHFFLLFEVDASDDLVTFRIDLNQYNTTRLYSSEIIASYTPSSPNGDNLILVLAITLPAVAGAAIVSVFVLKKRGKILTKTPRKTK